MDTTSLTAALEILKSARDVIKRAAQTDNGTGETLLALAKTDTKASDGGKGVTSHSSFALRGNEVKQ